jgi:hypothetical protein
MQPAMPTAVRQWVPDRIGLGTAVYGNGLLVGECVPVVLTLPWLLPLVDGRRTPLRHRELAGQRILARCVDRQLAL